VAATWVLHSANIAVNLNYMEKSVEPHQGPYTGGNIDPIVKPLILTPAKPTTLIFQAPLNVLMYLPFNLLLLGRLAVAIPLSSI
jgi:hypothetical protein